MDVVKLNSLAKLSFRIKKRMFLVNRGLSFNFILVGNLSSAKFDIFVDASTEWGIGGCCRNLLFKIHWQELRRLEVDAIARMELLAALMLFIVFGQLSRTRS